MPRAPSVPTVVEATAAAAAVEADVSAAASPLDSGHGFCIKCSLSSFHPTDIFGQIPVLLSKCFLSLRCSAGPWFTASTEVVAYIYIYNISSSSSSSRSNGRKGGGGGGGGGGSDG